MSLGQVTTTVIFQVQACSCTQYGHCHCTVDYHCHY